MSQGEKSVASLSEQGPIALWGVDDFVPLQYEKSPRWLFYENEGEYVLPANDTALITPVWWVLES